MQQIIVLIDMQYSRDDIDNPERAFIRILASDIFNTPPEELVAPFRDLLNDDTCIAIMSHDIFTGTANVDSFFVAKDDKHAKAN